jgi:hypothetical protein
VYVCLFLEAITACFDDNKSCNLLNIGNMSGPNWSLYHGIVRPNS